MNAPSPASDDVAFGRSADGLLVALVGETAFAMVPARDGRHFLVMGWRTSRPMGEWTRGDFYGHSGELADEAAFRNAVLENAEHQRERRLLGRIEQYSRAHTPWGISQGSTVYAEGVASYSTASHGGFKLSAERNRIVHSMLRSKGGWYEEDAEWAIVAITFPDLFTAFERRCSERTIKDSWPDAWEAISGASLQSGESREKDRRTFEQAHARDWIVVSAITSKHVSGFVETIATLGGKRGPGTEERRFLVPSNEYHVRGFGFVIDEAGHQLYGGPSDFVGWR